MDEMESKNILTIKEFSSRTGLSDFFTDFPLRNLIIPSCPVSIIPRACCLKMPL